MNKMSDGAFGITDKQECDVYGSIDNDCARCTYEAARLAANDVLSAVIRNELTQTEQAVIDLYWFRDMKIAQIAEIAGVARSSINKSLERAMNKIRKIMKYIVLYNEMVDGRKQMPDAFDISLIRRNDGKELLAV